MLPLLYNGLEPLNRNAHGNYHVRRLNGLDRVAATHAIPVTVDEFSMAQRHYPIVFSAGDAPVPIALMGLHEGTNTFFDESGVAYETNIYVPAYLRGFAKTAMSCRCASTRPRAQSASSRMARLCSTATSHRKRPRRSCSSASSSSRLGSAPRRS
jgi:hypothetical protein